MNEENIIEVSHLSKAYKLYDKKSDCLKEAISLSKKKYHKLHFALNDISFSIPKGEIVGIIGSNGSGKSTLLKILTGVTTQTSGQYSIKGRISALLELGAGFNQEYTGLENIALQGTLMGYSKEEMVEKTKDIIQFADIGEYINQPVKNYSSGMFARLAFSVAISVEPDILIVDEALSVGDVFFQNKCFQKFEELHKKHVTILFVSHDMNAVKEKCSRAIWIEQGQLQMFDTCPRVCEAYFNEQTRRMNEENSRYLHELHNQQSEISMMETEVRLFPAITITNNSMLSERAEIISTYVQDNTGSYVQSLNSGNSYKIGIVVKFHEALDNVIVGFVLNNAKNVSMLASNTYEQSHCGIKVRAEQVIEFGFRFTLPAIRSGAYEISPAVALGTQESHVNLTWLHGVKQVSISREGYELAEVGVSVTVESKNVTKYHLI